MKVTRFIGGAAAVLGALTTLQATPASADTGDGQGRTTVVLNPELVPTLVNLLHVRAVQPGRITANNGEVAASFPITDVDPGLISHSGGLAFDRVGGGTLKITSFTIDTTAGDLTAKARLDGNRLADRVPVFTLGTVQPINGSAPSCSGVAAGLSLTPQAAAALGAPSFAGVFVGDACVVPPADGDD